MSEPESTLKERRRKREEKSTKSELSKFLR